jgi:release factor glutamine methyltransferase
VNVAAALREATARLEAVSDTARLDAELLMAEALGVSRSEMLLRRTGDAEPELFQALITRRLAHEPVAQILGRKGFYGREFRVGRDVLTPRADSETTVAAALEAGPGATRLLDCGTGSGALLLTLLAELPQATGIGIDRSPGAIAVAQDNAVRLGLADRAEMRLADWHASGWATDIGQFDLVIANPPYVETAFALAPTVRDYEPHGALYAGSEGLDDYRVLVPQLPALLRPAGAAVLEIGASQAESVAAIARAVGFRGELRHDLGGRARALILRLGLV